MEAQPMPPPGGDQNRGYQIYVAYIIPFSFALLTTLSRLYVRLRVLNSFGWDDALIALAMAGAPTFAISVVGLGFNIVAVQNGLGRHIIYLPIDRAVKALKYSALGQEQNIIGICITKVSICCFVLRLLNRTNTTFRRWIYLLMGLVLLTNVGLFFLAIFECWPMSGQWDPRVKAKCVSRTIVINVSYFQGAFNCATDAILALFPMYFVRNLKMGQRTKAALMFLIGLGLVTSLAGLFRAVFLNELKETEDITWKTLDVSICAIVEENSAILAANLPGLKPLMIKVRDMTSSYFTSKQTGSRLFTRQRPSGASNDDNVPLKPLRIQKVSEFDVDTTDFRAGHRSNELVT